MITKRIASTDDLPTGNGDIDNSTDMIPWNPVGEDIPLEEPVTTDAVVEPGTAPDPAADQAELQEFLAAIEAAKDTDTTIEQLEPLQ